MAGIAPGEAEFLCFLVLQDVSGCVERFTTTRNRGMRSAYPSHMDFIMQAETEAVTWLRLGHP